MDTADLEGVYEAFQDFHAYFAPVFGRKESREHSRHYLQGLLVQSQERRNAENLVETVPASPRALQRFLTESPWEDDGVIGRLQEYLRSRLEDPEAVWVLDGSDFPKQGMKSVGVSRQYCGALGKIASCQAGGVSGPCGAQRSGVGGPAAVPAAGMDIGCGALWGGGVTGGAAGVPQQDGAGPGYAGASASSWLPRGAVGCWRLGFRDVAHPPQADGREFRRRECATCLTCGRTQQCGRWNPAGPPTRPIRGSGVPANPDCGGRSGKPWRSAARRCQQRPGG